VHWTTLGAGSAAAAAALLAGVQRSSRGARRPRSARLAEAEDKPAGGEGFLGADWGERTGFTNERPLPSNAEFYGNTIWFEVELKKPLGITIEDGPDGPGTGTGVGKVNEGGSAYQLMQEAIAGRPVMWVQEGDAFVTVNDIPTDGSTQKATQLVMEAEGPVKLGFARRKRGHIKVVFPNGKDITMPRGTRLQMAAEAVGYDSGCNSKEGRCKECWMKDEFTGEGYCLPLNVPGIIPSVWRKNEEQGNDSTNSAQYECWVPLKLVPAPELYEAEVAKEEDIKARNRAIRGNGKE
jgi:hypothetical protein